jgi:hypothetical protein
MLQLVNKLSTDPGFAFVRPARQKRSDEKRNDDSNPENDFAPHSRIESRRESRRKSPRNR